MTQTEISAGAVPRNVSAATGAVVAGRRSALDTIVDVLVANALNHGRGTITVRTGSDGGAVSLTVADAGSLTTDHEDLFERRRSNAGSSGIGLHLARSLAEAEGARLRLRSTLDISEPLVARSAPLPRSTRPGGGAIGPCHRLTTC